MDMDAQQNRRMQYYGSTYFTTVIGSQKAGLWTKLDLQKQTGDT